jgi:ribulose kinase
MGQDLEVLAECTEATAEAVNSLQEVLLMPILVLATKRKAMEQLSEAQSMMRIATQTVRTQISQQQHRDDTDQRDAYQWLVLLAKRHRIQLYRYATLRDPADPAEAGQLLEEIQEIKGVVARHRAGR